MPSLPTLLLAQKRQKKKLAATNIRLIARLLLAQPRKLSRQAQLYLEIFLLGANQRMRLLLASLPHASLLLVSQIVNQQTANPKIATFRFAKRFARNCR